MSLLQMTGMYQAIANDGVRIPPRIIKTTIAPDGTRTDEPRPEGVRVVSAQTAQTVRQHAAGDAAARSDGRTAGHRIAGVPSRAIRSPARRVRHSRSTQGCGCYYDDVYWITFAGIATADDPRYVVGVMMDNPHRTADGQPGTTAAPLFHNIAAWLLQRENVPLSPDSRPAAEPAGD